MAQKKRKKKGEVKRAVAKELKAGIFSGIEDFSSFFAKDRV